MIEQLFFKEPSRWGLRGDPYLWQELRHHLKQEKEPETEAELEAALTKGFETLVGEPLTPGKEIFVGKLSHGGMSSGFVSCDFWLQEGFPFLVKEFKQIKTSNHKTQ